MLNSKFMEYNALVALFCKNHACKTIDKSSVGIYRSKNHMQTFVDRFLRFPEMRNENAGI